MANHHRATSVVLLVSALVLAYCVTLAQAQDVPGPPTDAIVEVVDSTTVTVQWSAPVSDGGSQVTSYRVEWDTNPGEREEQAVTLSVDTGPNEVQTFSTVASDIDEVVSVHLRAALVEEVQTVTTSAFV